MQFGSQPSLWCHKGLQAPHQGWQLRSQWGRWLSFPNRCVEPMVDFSRTIRIFFPITNQWHKAVPGKQTSTVRNMQEINKGKMKKKNPKWAWPQAPQSYNLTDTQNLTVILPPAGDSDKQEMLACCFYCVWRAVTRCRSPSRLPPLPLLVARYDSHVSHLPAPRCCPTVADRQWWRGGGGETEVFPPIVRRERKRERGSLYTGEEQLLLF